MSPRTGLLAAILLASLIFTGCSQAQTPSAPATAAPTKAPTSGVAGAPATAAPTKAPASGATAAPQQTTAPASKSSFPEKGKSITFIVPWAAGGGADVTARMLAEGMEEVLGVPLAIVNKAGAAGQIGLTEIVNAKPDGYTIGLFVNPPSAVVYMDPTRKAGYNLTNLDLIANHAIDMGAVAVKADSPYKTVKDLVAAAKAKPGEVKIGTAGLLTIGHIAGLMLGKESGAQFNFVQLGGAPQAMTAMLGGDVDAVMETAATFIPHVKSGNMRVIGIMDTKESKLYPGVKTMEAQGYKVYFAMSRGIAAPAGTPKDIVKIYADAVKKTAESEKHKQKMEQAGIPIQYMDTAQYTDYCKGIEAQMKPVLELVNSK